MWVVGHDPNQALQRHKETGLSALRLGVFLRRGAAPCGSQHPMLFANKGNQVLGGDGQPHNPPPGMGPRTAQREENPPPPFVPSWHRAAAAAGGGDEYRPQALQTRRQQRGLGWLQENRGAQRRLDERPGTEGIKCQPQLPAGPPREPTPIWGTGLTAQPRARGRGDTAVTSTPRPTKPLCLQPAQLPPPSIHGPSSHWGGGGLTSLSTWGARRGLGAQQEREKGR